jgi:hypothetical protein
MRLINVDTLELKDFGFSTRPPYAILSHTWEEDEVTWQDFQDLEMAKAKSGFFKIECLCKQARLDGLGWAWIDTCCIFKNDSHELQEAINSMFRYALG